MKKLITLAVCLGLALSFAACKESSSGGDINTDISEIAILIDRGILTDAVWGVGEEIPADITCVAGSQFEFDATDNPFFISKNDNGDPHFVTPAIITSSLNINMPADEIGSRSDTCAVGDLYYIISATPDIPIDIVVADENCPSIEAIASAEGALFPVTGTVTAHIEAHEVDLLAASCQVEESTVEETGDVSETGNPEATDDSEAVPSAADNGEETVEEVVDEIVEEIVEEETVVEEEVVEEEVVEEEETTDGPRRTKKSTTAITKDENTGCASLPVQMFVVVIDSCGGDTTDDVETVEDAEGTVEETEVVPE